MSCGKTIFRTSSGKLWISYPKKFLETLLFYLAVKQRLSLFGVTPNSF